MVYVLLAITLVSAAVIILTGASMSLTFQARDEYLRACSSNLTASGEAWVRRPGAVVTVGRAKRLDVEALEIPAGRLEVTLSREGVADINSYCRRGKSSQKDHNRVVLGQEKTP